MDSNMDKMAKETIISDKASTEDHGVGTTTTIYIDPAREAAVRRKFDIYVVPVSVIYLVLSTLDRNNVSCITHTLSKSLTSSAWQCSSLRLRRGYRVEKRPVWQHPDPLQRLHRPL
jgi:hypothetical protein